MGNDNKVMKTVYNETQNLQRCKMTTETQNAHKLPKLTTKRRKLTTKRRKMTKKETQDEKKETQNDLKVTEMQNDNKTNTK